jgi:hypothetical protein
MIYAHSWYLDLVNDNWEALVKNDYESVMPLTPGKKLGFDYLYQPKFTQQLGVFSQSHLTELSLEEFLNAIPKKYKFIEINLNTYNKVNDQSKHFTPWLTHHLDLINSYENIAAKYSTNLKRNLKKAQKSNLSIVDNIKPEDIIQVFRSNKGKDISNLKDSDYDLLRRMIYVMIYKRTARVVGVYNEMNELCAGAFFVFSGKKVIFFFSGTNALAKNTAAMPLLIDDFIRKHAGSHLTFDFEGSNDPNLARFYKSFGSEEVNYLHYHHNKLHPVLKAGLMIKKKFIFAIKH